VRELFEETGLSLAPSDLVGPVYSRSAVFDFFRESCRQEEVFFVARDADGSGRAGLEVFEGNGTGVGFAGVHVDDGAGDDLVVLLDKVGAGEAGGRKGEAGEASAGAGRGASGYQACERGGKG